MALPWSKKAVLALYNGAGTYGLSFFRRKSGSSSGEPGAPFRSRAAIYAKMAREHGPGGLTRGVQSVNEVMAETGYSRSQLVRAKQALNQKWRRTSPKGSHLISGEQVEDMVAWLGHDYWQVSKHLYGCVKCHSKERPHKGLGLCTQCYAMTRKRRRKKS